MKISIIIPTYNAGENFSNLLKMLTTQTVQDFELLIIDSSSSDNTLDLAKEYTDKIIVIPSCEFDHGGTRARAARIAKGDILVFLTQDALPFNEYTIENIIKVFDKENLSAAYGKQVSYVDTNLFGKHLREFNYSDVSTEKCKQDIKTYGIKTAQLSNSFAAYRKSTLEEVGSFKENLILGEDVYIGAKMILAGYCLAYVSEAKVYHSHSYSVWQEFKRYFDIGVFHKSEEWILDEFGKAEGEGMKYIKSEVSYLIKNRALFLLPEFFIRNGMKYLGYKVGQKNEQLPMWLISFLSMHHRWWGKQKNKI